MWRTLFNKCSQPVQRNNYDGVYKTVGGSGGKGATCVTVGEKCSKWYKREVMYNILNTYYTMFVCACKSSHILVCLE